MRLLPDPALEFHPARDELGEGPAWDPRTGELLWVDIVRGRLARCVLDSRTGGSPQVDVQDFGQMISAVLPRRGGGLVVAAADGLHLITPDGAVDRVVAVEADIPTNRLGDMGVDPRGRLWFDTLDHDMTAGRGALYRLDLDGSLSQVISQTSIANGVGWSPDGATMYFVDSATGRVDALDYDLDTGAATNRRPWVVVSHEDGSPDGLAVDREGGVWVALWGGAQVRRYGPDGEVDVVVPLPVRNVTSCCFAGPALDRLFITTARVDMDERSLLAEPLAGSVFTVDPGTTGLALEPYGA